jgi:hypothetical protein
VGSGFKREPTAGKFAFVGPEGSAPTGLPARVMLVRKAKSSRSFADPALFASHRDWCGGWGGTESPAHHSEPGKPYIFAAEAETTDSPIIPPERHEASLGRAADGQMGMFGGSKKRAS